MAIFNQRLKMGVNKTMFKTATPGANDFVPTKDVTRFTDDGREIVVARAGTPMPMAKAHQLGLIKDEKKADAPTANKAASPKENK